MKPAFLELRTLAGDRASTLHWLHHGEQPGSGERTRRLELMEALDQDSGSGDGQSRQW